MKRKKIYQFSIVSTRDLDLIGRNTWIIIPVSEFILTISDTYLAINL
jgi:hypothetical protein